MRINGIVTMEINNEDQQDSHSDDQQCSHSEDQHIEDQQDSHKYQGSVDSDDVYANIMQECYSWV